MSHSLYQKIDRRVTDLTLHCPKELKGVDFPFPYLKNLTLLGDDFDLNLFAESPLESLNVAFCGRYKIDGCKFPYLKEFRFNTLHDQHLKTSHFVFPPNTKMYRLNTKLLKYSQIGCYSQWMKKKNTVTRKQRI